MKAVIMAGGQGTRLRPLTCDIPKPMARLCGRPILEYILDLLCSHGVTHGYLTLRYLPNIIRSHFPEGRYKTMSLSFVEEDKPLGTAGSVKNAAGDIDEDFIVISGDAMTDLDLSAAMATHKKNKAAATIVVCSVPDPREYGLVDFDENGRVTGFIEKPSFAQAVTDTANTGIYILSPKALEYIPENRPFDFAKDLFPLLLSRDEPLFVHEAKGYWCDIGDLATYARCQQDMLSGKIRCRLPREIAQGVYSPSPLPPGNYTITPPCYIGEGVTIEEGATLGPGTVVDDRSFIGRRAKVKSSILLPASFVGDRASLSGAILCPGASVKRAASLFEGAVIGTGATVGEEAAVNPGVCIWPRKIVEDGAIVRDNLQYGIARAALFDDDGITGETGVELTPEFCARIGAAAASLKEGKRIGIACSREKSASALKLAMISGMLSAGAQVFDFGESFEAELNFALSFCGLKLGVFLQSGPVGRIKIAAAGGLPPTRPMERELENSIIKGEFSRSAWDSYKERVELKGIRQLYTEHLSRLAKEDLAGMSAIVKSANRLAGKVLTEVLLNLGCGIAEGMTLHLSEDGTRLSILDYELGYIWPEKVFALCCQMEFEKGKDVALPADAPRALDSLAARYGRRILRYLACPADSSDSKARELAETQLWARDGLACAVMLLSYMKETGKTLPELMENLPDFARVVRSVRCEGNPGNIIKLFSGELNSRGTCLAQTEGIGIKLGSGIVTIRPTKRGKSLVMLAEAANYETASELCDGLERLIKSKSIDIKGK